jgi:hypothetical protein
MADAAAILATDDATLGEGYFSVGRNGRREGAIRELGHTKVNGPSIGPVVRRYDAIRHDTEPHAAGGVVSSTFLEIRARLGRQAAERLLWAVIRDDAAWRQGGSWREFAQAIQRAAEHLWSSSVRGEIAAVAAAMRATKLDTALA